MRKGVSPVVATVLLISLTIVLALIVYLWAQGLVKEQIEKYGQNAEQVCDQLIFDAEIVHESGNIFDLYLTNQGNVPIYAVDIKKIGKGKSIVDRRTISLSEGGASKEALTLERSSYDAIAVIPVILGSIRGTQNDRPYACPQQYGKQLELPM